LIAGLRNKNLSGPLGKQLDIIFCNAGRCGLAQSVYPDSTLPASSWQAQLPELGTWQAKLGVRHMNVVCSRIGACTAGVGWGDDDASCTSDDGGVGSSGIA
jgi:hypothetical protein